MFSQETDPDEPKVEAKYSLLQKFNEALLKALTNQSPEGTVLRSTYSLERIFYTSTIFQTPAGGEEGEVSWMVGIVDWGEGEILDGLNMFIIFNQPEYHEKLVVNMLYDESGGETVLRITQMILIIKKDPGAQDKKEVGIIIGSDSRTIGVLNKQGLNELIGTKGNIGKISEKNKFLRESGTNLIEDLVKEGYLPKEILDPKKYINFWETLAYFVAINPGLEFFKLHNGSYALRPIVAFEEVR